MQARTFCVQNHSHASLVGSTPCAVARLDQKALVLAVPAVCVRWRYLCRSCLSVDIDLRWAVRDVGPWGGRRNATTEKGLRVILGYGTMTSSTSGCTISDAFLSACHTTRKIRSGDFSTDLLLAAAFLPCHFKPGATSSVTLGPPHTGAVRCALISGHSNHP